MFEGIENYGSRPAVLERSGATYSYSELCMMSAELLSKIREDTNLPERPLVVLKATNDMVSVAAYIGFLRAGWPVIMARPDDEDASASLIGNFEPSLVVSASGMDLVVQPVSGTPLPMHPDLRLLLSTSGSTGSPKLVRLSDQNIRSNAAAIVEYLGITSDDRTITTLPPSYSYGLSVINSYLTAGASIVLNDLSVTSESFWETVESAGVTSLALVPHQVRIIQGGGFLSRRRGKLRYITQAGGRLNPDEVLDFAKLGHKSGWSLVVMYGQTEASPRMSYLPADLLEKHPDSIGRAIPGGDISLQREDGRAVGDADEPGELVYRGPNVMMGYAEAARDLILPQGPSLLATGDVAERIGDGVFRIVGRKSRFAKVFGLRISLDDLEAHLGGMSLEGYCVTCNEKIGVFLKGPLQQDCSAVAQTLSDWLGLPRAVLLMSIIEEIPLTNNGKTDYRRLEAKLSEAIRETFTVEVPSGSMLHEAFEAALGRNRLDLSKSFVELGGDSLSYLQVQMALESNLGEVPKNWEHRALADLLSHDYPEFSRIAGGASVPADVVLRIAAIAGVIALHATEVPSEGGAHLLTMLVGVSLVRFQMVNLAAGRLNSFLRSMLGRILPAYFLILAGCTILWKPVDVEWFLLLGNFDRNIHPGGIEPYWFIAMYTQTMVLVALVFAIPKARIWIAAHTVLAGLILFAVTLAATGIFSTDEPSLALRNPLYALQLIALGWVLWLLRDSRPKTAIAGGLAASLLWAEGELAVTAFLVAGVLGVVAIQEVSVPRPMVRPLLQLGAASLFIYLLHPFVIMIQARLFGESLFALPITLAASAFAGVVAWQAMAHLDLWFRSRPTRPVTGDVP